jgi:Transglutaminase-like superfamily
MKPLTSDESTDRVDNNKSNQIKLVSTLTTDMRLRPGIGSRWLAGFGIVAAFIGGFGVSFLTRPANVPAEPKIQIADFRVSVPEGETTITISSRQGTGQELGQLRIRRKGDTIVGVPETERVIAARERLSAEDAAFFRRELVGVVLSSDSRWERANKIRAWLTLQPHHLALPGLATRVPREAYEQMKLGSPVLCGNLAEIYVAMCEAAGLSARTVELGVAVQNGLFGVDTHVGAEVWLPDMGGWIYQDPTFNCYWEIEGKPASALILHDAIMAGRQISFAPRTKLTEAGLRNYYLDPRLYFRHISYEYKVGGSVLYFADSRLEPLSLIDKNWIHTGERADIERLDDGGNLIVERRTQIVPGVFVQLLGDELFIRDRRERSPGIRVRSSSGPIEGCAYLHQRAEDMGIFSALNLARNPSFRLTSRSDQLADEWSVAGPVEAMTVAGGQAMAALAGGRLSQRVQARAHGRYLLYARISVSRGLVNWSIADSAQGAKSMGTIEPERISEVVSDVVESESGYLDIQFDVPSGGAFRVMDVIVAEAPRFVNDNGRPAGNGKQTIARLY